MNSSKFLTLGTIMTVNNGYLKIKVHYFKCLDDVLGPVFGLNIAVSNR